MSSLLAEDWTKKYEQSVKPLFKHLDRPNGVLANYFVECIRSLKHDKEGITVKNVIEELKNKAIDLSLLDYPEYYYMFENAINYYIEWESLSHEDKDIIKKAREERYKSKPELEQMTDKQKKFLTYLVCSTVDYGRKLYITGVSNGNGSGDLIPVLLPKDYDFKVTYLDDLNKWEAMQIIDVLNKARRQEDYEILDQVNDTTAKKIQLDEQEITLYEFLQGQRVLLGIEID